MAGGRQIVASSSIQAWPMQLGASFDAYLVACLLGLQAVHRDASIAHRCASAVSFRGCRLRQCKCGSIQCDLSGQ